MPDVSTMCRSAGRADTFEYGFRHIAVDVSLLRDDGASDMAPTAPASHTDVVCDGESAHVVNSHTTGVLVSQLAGGLGELHRRNHTL
jgi:hypothetical protein